MFKKIFSLFQRIEPQATAEIPELVIQPLNINDRLILSLIGQVNVIIDASKEPSMMMHIAPTLQQYLTMGDDSIAFNIGNVNYINDALLFNHVLYPEPHITIYIPSLSYLQLDGSSDYRVQCHDEHKALEMEINNTGDVQLDLRLHHVNISLTGTGDANISSYGHSFQIDTCGTGDITIQGDAHTTNMIHGGTGDLIAKSFYANEGCLTVSGVGDVKASIHTLLRCDFDSVGDITVYTNTPEKLAQQRDTGKVKHRPYSSSPRAPEIQPG